MSIAQQGFILLHSAETKVEHKNLSFMDCKIIP